MLELVADYGLEAPADLDPVVPTDARTLLADDAQRAIPAIARNVNLLGEIDYAVRGLPTRHRVYRGDSRDMASIPDHSVHLVVTSPPYWTLKEYPGQVGQLGAVADYEAFLAALDDVWRHALRVLVPGGRLIVVVGDVCLSRREYGRHVVFPLHASIQEHCRQLGFDNLAPIIWYKIANARFEVENGSSFLGKPYEPNAVIKNDIEFILFQRKPGGYRKPSNAARALSVIPETRHKEWFQQVWDIRGASTRDHPAPYPESLAERLIRMFSFVGDTVLDPFLGTGTTSVAAARWGRNSIGIEVEPGYVEYARRRIEVVLSQPQLTAPRAPEAMTSSAAAWSASASTPGLASWRPRARTSSATTTTPSRRLTWERSSSCVAC
jgi:modification methylase